MKFPLPRFFLFKPRWSGTGLALLGAIGLGTGVTAIAVVPLSDPATLPPVQQIRQSIRVPNVQKAQQQTAGPALLLYRSDLTRPGDTPEELLTRLGLHDPAAVAFLRQETQAQALWSGHSGELVTAETWGDQRLKRLSARWFDPSQPLNFTRLVVERRGSDDTLRARLEKGPVRRHVKVAQGSVNTSLFAATDAAQIPDSVAKQFAEAMTSQVDLRHGLATGDRFVVVYESFEAQGETLQHGQLLGAELVHAGQSHRLVWFNDTAKNTGQFYTLNGESLQRAFLASPLGFSRVSSGYGMRVHPIAQRHKAHMGMDFSAPTGTPVRSIADGVVEFAGWKGPYGQMVVVQHREQRSTAYAHLSRIGVRVGQRLRQGEWLGAVGNTGLSTGPHLHFEYRVNQQPQNPMQLARLPDQQPSPVTQRPDFKQHAQAMRQQLEQAATWSVSQANFD